MPYCVFDCTSGVFLSGTMYDPIPYDPGTQIQLALPYYPDRRTVRWDGATGVRTATLQEINDYDTMTKSEIADAQLKLAGAAILETTYAISYEQPVWSLLYQFIKNPALYATQNAFLLAVKEATAFPTIQDFKAQAKANYIAKLNGN